MNLNNIAIAKIAIAILVANKMTSVNGIKNCTYEITNTHMLASRHSH